MGTQVKASSVTPGKTQAKVKGESNAYNTAKTLIQVNSGDYYMGQGKRQTSVNTVACIFQGNQDHPKKLTEKVLHCSILSSFFKPN